MQRQRLAIILSTFACVFLVAGWSAAAWHKLQGRGGGSGDVAAGMAGLGDLIILTFLGLCALLAAILAYIAQRRAPDLALPTTVLAAGLATLVASVLFVFFPVFP